MTSFKPFEILYIVIVRIILQMFSFFTKILEGWKECYYHFLAWKFLLQYPYNSYNTWEFFSYLNREIQKPYTIYVALEEYDKFVQMLEESDVQS